MYMKNILDYSTFLKSGITEGRLGRLGALASVVAATSCLSPDPKGDWVVANINTTDRGSCEYFLVQKTGPGLPHRKTIEDSCGKWEYNQTVQLEDIPD